MFKASIIGRLTRDATTSNMNGRAVTNFDVAVDTLRKGDDGKRIPNYLRVAAWGKLGELSATLTKGQAVFVQGDIEQREYKKNDGTTGMALNVTADTIQFLSKPAQREREQADPFAS